MSLFCPNFKNILKSLISFLGGAKTVTATPFRKRVTFAIIAIVIFTIFGLETFVAQKAQAATGVRHIINFQGKVVNSDGTNVADGLYRFQFKIYTQSSGGAAVWTEDRDTVNKVQVTGGIFQVGLGSVTALPGSVDFNTDNIYLGITFHTEGSEMTPRIQFATVPQAFNAEKVNGLTVTNTSNNPFSSATILKIADGKTVSINAGLTFTGTDTTTFTFPSTGGNVVTEDFAQTLTNKIIGSTGLTFTGATTDITTGTNQDLAIVPNGTGKVSINTTSPLASFDVRDNPNGGGTIAVASFSGTTAFAALIADNRGLGDIFSASTGGVAKFTVLNSGQIRSSQYTANGGILYTSTNGIISQTAGGTNGNCLTFTGGLPAWGPCSSGGGSSDWTTGSTGYFRPNNGTLDVLFGLNATNASSAAKFAILNLADDSTTNNPSASVSAITGNNAGNGIAIRGDGSIQTFRNNTLTLGGSTTGNIFLSPLGGGGTGYVNIYGKANVINKIFRVGPTDYPTTFAASGVNSGLVVIDKANTGSDSSVVFRDQGNVRGEIGLVGDNQIHFKTATGTHDSETYTDRLIIETDGDAYFLNKVGIGTSPVELFHLAANQTGSRVLAKIENTSAGSSRATGIQLAGTGVDWTFGTDAGLNGGSNFFIQDNGAGYPPRILIDSKGQVGFGLDTPTAPLHVYGGAQGGNALAIFNQIGDSSNDILTASSGGTAKFTVTNGGNIQLVGGTTITNSTSGALGLGTTSNTTALTLGNSGTNTNVTIGVGTSGNLILQRNGSALDCSGFNNTGKLTTNSSGQVVCANDVSSGGGTVPTFDIANGLLYNSNQSTDFAIGGGSSTSAKFVVSMNGTLATASISAKSSYAGLVVDNSGVGAIFTASASGATRFLVAQNGAVGINTNSIGAGLKLDVVGSARIGTTSTATTDDIVKSTSADYAVSGSSSTSVTTTGDKATLILDRTAAIVAPIAGPTLSTGIATMSAAIRRPDGKVFVMTGNGTNQMVNLMYDRSLNSFTTGTSLPPTVVGASASASFQTADGKTIVAIGGSSYAYDPAGAGAAGTAGLGIFRKGGDLAQTTANGNNTSVVGSGARTILRPDGKVILILGGNNRMTNLYDPTTSLFSYGPQMSANVASGSAVFQRPDGQWVIIHGGATNTTTIYTPSVGSGGSTAAGPTLATGNAGNGAHVFQLPDGRFMIINGGNTNTTNIYTPATNVFSAGPTLTDLAGTGAQSFQRADGKWVTIIGNGSNATNLYDPVANTFTRPASSDLSGSVGVGALTVQRDDGRYLVIHGGINGTGSTIFDAGWNTNGIWVSEDINNTKISTYSAILWSAVPQLMASPSSNVQMQVKTAATQGGLTGASYITIQNTGDLIQAVGMAQWVKIQVNFFAQIPNPYAVDVPYEIQTAVWPAEGGTSYYRQPQAPTLFELRIQNPIAGYGGLIAGDPSQGRNGATMSAILDGVTTDDSNRLTLAQNRNTPTSTASAGIVIASASANLGTNVGAGAMTLQRNDGRYVVIVGGGSGTTRIYDPATGAFTVGPGLTTTVTTGSVGIQLPNGNFLVAVGTSTTTNIYDQNANMFYPGPSLGANTGTGAHAFQRPDGKFIIIRGGALLTTDIYDPFANAMSPGPSLTLGATTGAHSFRRSNGKIVVALSTVHNIYQPDSNSFTVAPVGVGTVAAGAHAVQIPNGNFIDLRGGTVESIYDNRLYTETAGTALAGGGTLGAGGSSMYLPDGKIFLANAAASTIIESNSVSGSFAGPALPFTIGAGGHNFQLPNGKYVVIGGGSTANSMIIDTGLNLQGTYVSEPIYAPALSVNTTLFWKNVGQGNIAAKYRTAASANALAAAAWVDLEKDDGQLAPTPGDTYVQVRFDMQATMPNQLYEKQRVWGSDTGGGQTLYYRQPQSPILQYWRLVNNTDPNVLTLTNGGSNQFRFGADGQAYTAQNGAWNSGGADLAERYTTEDDLKAAEVVTLDRLHPTYTKRSTMPYDPNIMGVVSTEPGFVAGAYTANSEPIALVGRVPVKVSTENGEIKAGDYLTSASIPGYAMKATVAGRVLGQAMEDFTPSPNPDLSVCPHEGMGNITTTQCGTITIFVNLTQYNGESVDVALSKSGYVLNENDIPVIPGIDFTPGTTDRHQQEILGFLRSQQDHGQSIYTDHLAVTQDIISPKIVTDLLVAKKIRAESIEGLEILTNNIEQLSLRVGSGSAVTNFADKLTDLSSAQFGLSQQVASITASLDKMKALSLLSFVPQGSASSELTMVNNFASYGTTTLSEASVMSTISIGTSTTIGDGSINTVGTDLEIQPLKQGGVSFLSGLINFASDGKAVFKEDTVFEKNVAVQGVLSAHTISSTELLLGQSEVKILDDGSVESTGAAGLITMKKDTKEIKVVNPLVKEKSLIFITPKTKTTQPLFLLDQVEGNSFTVGTEGLLDADVKFNYLIVN